MPWAKLNTPDAGLLEKHRERRDHDRSDHRGGDVDLLQRHEPAENLEVDRSLRQVQVIVNHHLRLAAEHEFAEPDEEVGQAERRHEQDDVGLVDQRAQHQPLDAEGKDEHHPDGHRERDKGRHALPVQPHERERREHHHDALREIEHAGRLEDQRKAERDQRVEHAGDEPLPQRLHQQVGRLPHLHERVDEDLIEDVHRSAQCATPR